MQTENCLHLFQIKLAPCGIRLLQQFLNFYFEVESCLCPVCTTLRVNGKWKCGSLLVNKAITKRFLVQHPLFNRFHLATSSIHSATDQQIHIFPLKLEVFRRLLMCLQALVLTFSKENRQKEAKTQKSQELSQNDQIPNLK